MSPQWLKPSNGAFPRPVAFYFPIALGLSDKPVSTAHRILGGLALARLPGLILDLVLLQLSRLSVPPLSLACSLPLEGLHPCCGFCTLVSLSPPWPPFPLLIHLVSCPQARHPIPWLVQIPVKCTHRTTCLSPAGLPELSFYIYWCNSLLHICSLTRLEHLGVGTVWHSAHCPGIVSIQYLFVK